MSKVQAIVGPSSTGKTTSLRNMNPEETYIINILGKDLPWRGSRADFNSTKKNIASVDRWDTVVEILKGISENRKEVKHIFIDDAGFIMTNEFFARAKESGLN